jgi:hypothetical protein
MEGTRKSNPPEGPLVYPTTHVIESDIPGDMTCDEYRRLVNPPSPSLLRKILQVIRLTERERVTAYLAERAQWARERGQTGEAIEAASLEETLTTMTDAEFEQCERQRAA